MQVKYSEWGLAENNAIKEVLAVREFSDDIKQKGVAVVHANVDLIGFELKKTALVKNYQGKSLPM